MGHHSVFFLSLFLSVAALRCKRFSRQRQRGPGSSRGKLRDHSAVYFISFHGRLISMLTSEPIYFSCRIIKMRKTRFGICIFHRSRLVHEPNFDRLPSSRLAAGRNGESAPSAGSIGAVQRWRDIFPRKHDPRVPQPCGLVCGCNLRNS